MINRRLDKLGRVVIPQEMRSRLSITHNTLLDITMEGDKIVLAKSGESCALCGETGNMLPGAHVCRACAENIAERLNAEKTE